MFQRRRQDQQRNLGVYLLAYQMMASGPIPPVTLAAIGLQVVVYLGYLPQLALSKTRSMCLIPSKVIESGEWWRLLAPVIMHGDDMHLYYNMVSLLYKGRKLERHLGAARFATILAVFSIASTLTTIAVSFILDGIADQGFMYQCAVGFSGVLFALKVLMNAYFPYENQSAFGWLPVPSRYACWVELVLIQMLTPNVSFVGHLAGILVGLMYTAGPLKAIVDVLVGAFDLTAGAGRNQYEPSAPYNDGEEDEAYRRPYAGAFTGQGATTGGGSARRRLFDEYTGGLTEEEQMRRAMEESTSGSNYGWRFQ